jgi:hypothetical protein
MKLFADVLQLAGVAGFGAGAYLVAGFGGLLVAVSLVAVTVGVLLELRRT